MGLNDIQLPAQTIVDLYKNHLCEEEGSNSPVKPALVEKSKPIKEEKPTTLSPISFLGKNLMHLVILVNYENEVYLPENQLNFIGNILKACKMNLADVAIINCNKQVISIATLLEQLNPKYLVIFDVDPSTINLSLELTPFSISAVNGIELFTSLPLEKLNQDGEEGKLLKSRLWLCMKKMLNL